jgi:hypothetical protein
MDVWYEYCYLIYSFCFKKEKKVEKQVIENSMVSKRSLNKEFDFNHLVSDEDFCKNLNAILAYYQMSKGEAKKRFVSRQW